jgi:hypothetical protein
MADTGGDEFHQNFARAGTGKIELFHRRIMRPVPKHGSPDLHYDVLVAI